MAAKIFYSWQSDLRPANQHRYFIQDALDNAAEAINQDESTPIEAIIDRDTQGVSGAVNIIDVILDKIEQSEIFVCDVSFINANCETCQRLTPNPNVLVELGYALKDLGEERIILILNTASGSVDDLPFDFRQNRTMMYTLPGENSRARELAKLQKELEVAIRGMLKQGSRFPQPSRPVVDMNEYLSDYGLDDPSSPQFGAEFVKDLFTQRIVDRQWKLTHAQTATIFLVSPSVQVEESVNTIIDRAYQLFTQWHNDAVQDKSKYFAHAIFPINPDYIRLRQREVVASYLLNREYKLSELRVNDHGAFTFVTSFPTVYLPMIYTNDARHDESQYFKLGSIIHIFWSFLCLARFFYEQINYEGEVHAHIAMKGTQETQLGHFAELNLDPTSRYYRPDPSSSLKICDDPNLLISRENIILSEFQYKVEPDLLEDMAREIAKAYGYLGAPCFDREGKLPDNLWPHSFY